VKAVGKQISAGHVTTGFWDVHGVLLVDFTPPGSTINAAVFQETLKGDSRRLFGARDQDCCSKEFFCTAVLDLTLLPQP
jgi:hypothetical protein